MEYKLEDLLLKTSDQLDNSERDFLRANKDKLGEEDVEAYKDFLNEDEQVDLLPPSDDGSEEPGNPEDEPVEEAANEPEETPAEDKKPAFQFTTEQEARDFVLKLQKEQDAEKQKAIDAARTPEEKRYVEDNWMPKDWNQGLAKVDELVEKKFEEERQKQIAANLQKEWEGLATEKGLPATTTTEGKIIHDSIVRFGVAANKQTFRDAYDVWSKVPKEFGGGLEVATVAEAKKEDETKKKEQGKAQRKAASKLATDNKDTSVKGHSAVRQPTYEELHNAKSANDLLQKMGVID